MVNFVAHARKMDQKSAKNGKNGTKDMKNGSKMAQKWSKDVIFFHKSGIKIEYCGLESIKVCMKMKKGLEMHKKQ